MGLDMYLSRSSFIWSDEREKIKITGVDKHKIKPERIKRIIEDVGYWRKANAIHAWFVKNVQNGIDDCSQYYVPREKLTKLLETVREVLENKDRASELLPTQEGFFFGSYEYDEWYWEDMEATKKILESVLKDYPESDFYYQSSW